MDVLDVMDLWDAMDAWHDMDACDGMDYRMDYGIDVYDGCKCGMDV